MKSFSISGCEKDQIEIPSIAEVSLGLLEVYQLLKDWMSGQASGYADQRLAESLLQWWKLAERFCDRRSGRKQVLQQALVDVAGAFVFRSVSHVVCGI